jgi:hypothetical protein
MIAPVFVFDSRERWSPVGVEESLKAAHARHYDGAVDAPARWPFKGGRLNFPPDMRQPDLPPVGYHRVAPFKLPSGLLVYAHQFWLWSLYNSWSVAGVGKHEGDWEMVQLICVDEAGEHPILVTASQHHSGGKREAWACERTFPIADPTRPNIYVALGSHANYFAPGVQGGGQDVCDAKGREMHDIEWREFGPWASWPGRWGNSTGEGKSPESPGCQGHRWTAPHLFHSSAR